jgi:hypothetical protein
MIRNLGKLLAELKASGEWMLRMSNDGKSYNGFRWQPLGRWTEAPDWNPEPICGGGLHGQGPGGYGYAHSSTRLDLCQTRGPRIIVDGDKVKVQAARIIATDDDALRAALLLCDGAWPGSLYCRGYTGDLSALASVGGPLDCDSSRREVLQAQIGRTK